MAVDNYTDLQLAVAAWMNRADLVQNIPDFITLAEAEFNRTIRDTRMIATTSALAITAGTRTVAVPADMLTPNYVSVVGGGPLASADMDQVTRLRMIRLSKPGSPLYYALNGRNLELVPIPNASGNLEMEYYQQIPPLATAPNGTNWLLQFAPDLYLNTSIKYAKLFLQDYGTPFGDQADAAANQVEKQAADATLSAGRTAGYSFDSPSDNSRSMSGSAQQP